MDNGELVRLQLLGAFRVVVGGQVVADRDWRLRKARSLVKLLALTPDQRVTREQIIELLWPDLDPDAAANNLRVALHAARRALAPHGDVTSRDGTLALESVGALWIDVAAFESAAATARRSHEPTDYARALDLYGGELLPEDRYEDWASGRRDFLQGLYLALLLEQATAHEARGEWTPAIAAMQRALLVEPTHEDAHIGLMRLHALAGQRAAALRQWDQLVAALRRDLDAAPDAASRVLYEEIAAGRFPPTSESVPAATGRYRHNLPAPLTALIGRDADLLAVKGILAQGRLLTLTGAGGCGKTRLAIAVATDLLAAYPGGVWLVELAALADPALVPSTVASALGLHEEPDQTPLDALAVHLAEQATLLVLDNCEHLRDACAELAEQLLMACPRLRLLATSRAALGLPGEVVWRVPSLRVPGPLVGRLPRRALDELAVVPAVHLFLERVRARQPTFALTPEHAPAIAEIVRRLDGIPLALELAAARVALLPVETLAARLDDALGVLGGGTRHAAPRHRTLRATLDWSYGLLDSGSRTLLAHLSIFAGGCTLDAIETVCAESRMEIGEFRKGPQKAPFSILDALADLVDHSLVQVEADAPGGRYRLLETVRQYGAERLQEADENERLRRRHADFFGSMAEMAAPQMTGAEKGQWLARLEQDHDNLRAALRWAIASGEATAGMRLAGALWRFWYNHGHISEGRRWLDQVLALPASTADPAEPAARARALYGAGGLAYAQGDYGRATVLSEAALELQRTLNDRAGIAATLNTLAIIAREGRDQTRARALNEESLALKRELGDVWGIAASLNNLGNLARDEGDYPRAAALFEESLALLRQVGDLAAIALRLNNLAEMTQYLGDLAQASALYRESLELFRQIEDKGGAAMALDNLAVLAAEQGDYAHAITLHQETLASYRELGDRTGIAVTLTNLGEALLNQGDRGRSPALHQEAREIFGEIGNPWGLALVANNSGNVARATGDLAEAKARYVESEAGFRAIGNRWGLSLALLNLGRVALALHDQDEAQARFREGLILCQEAHDRTTLPACLEGLAAVADLRGESSQATRLLAAAATLRAELGVPLPTIGLPDHERRLAALHAALGADTFAAAWAAGQALPADEAVALALALD